MSRKSGLSGLFGRRFVPPFPESFMFGVANADHQCEAHDPVREDIRDLWERQQRLTMRGSATDFENRYGEDIELAGDLGCTAFRFSLAWSRLEPEPGRFDDRTFEHYRHLIAAVRAANMQPIVTLHHFTWPVHIERRGGMICDDFPPMYACYVTEVAKRLGSQVDYWVTFNEPNQLIYGYLKPWWEPSYFSPPGLPAGASLAYQIAAVGKLIRNLFKAHTIARRLLKRHNPSAKVGTNPLVLGLPGWLQCRVDSSATRIGSQETLKASGNRFGRRAVPVSGQVDLVIASLTRTPEREKQVSFSEPYFSAGQMLLVKATSTATRSQDLDGEAVAVVESSTAERDIGSLMPGAAVRVERDHASALGALDDGQVEAVLSDDSLLLGSIAQHPARYRLVGHRLTREDYAVAASPGSGDLVDVVDLVIKQFNTSGAWSASWPRHLSRSEFEPPEAKLRALNVDGRSETSSPEYDRFDGPSVPLPLADRGTALRHVQDRGYLLVAVNTDVKGLSYQDPSSGEFTGLEVDLGRAIAKRIFGDPGRIRFRPVTTQGRISVLRSPLQLLDPLFKLYSILSTAFTSNWWHLGMAGRLNPFLCPEECIGQQDFVGIDYYWGTSTFRLDRILRLLDAANGRFDRAPVWPEALYDALRYHAELLPHLPILILENGSVDVADGVDRANYLRKHIYQVQRAISKGANVAAYVCWSITSNREWGHAFAHSNDFGLHHIDLDTDPDLTRVPTPAAAAYKEIIAGRGVPQYTLPG